MSSTPSLWSLGTWSAVDWANHLWQSSVVALALLLLLALCGRLSARTRLAIAWLAVGKFAMPLAALAAVKNLLFGAAAPVAMPLGDAAAVASPSAALALTSPPPAPSATLFPLSIPVSLPGASFFLWLWFAGFVVLLALWWARALLARRRQLADTSTPAPVVAQAIRDAAATVRLSRPPRCVVSESGHGPALLGLFSPVIVLPRGLEETLTPAELRAVLAHEFVHLRWRDHLVGAFQALMVGLLWFNPVAWLLNRRLSLETEKACDERVVELTGDPEAYASGIVKTVRLSLGLHAPGVLGVTTPPVVGRLQDILDPSPRYRSRFYHCVAFAVALTLMGLGARTSALLAQAVAAEPAFVAPAAVTLAATPAVANDHRAAGESRPAVVAQPPIPATPAATPPAEPPPPAAKKSSDDATLSIDFRDTDIRELLRRIADLYEINLVIPATLQGTATVTLRDATWRQIFKAVLEPRGYTFELEDKIVHIRRTASPAPVTPAPKSESTPRLTNTPGGSGWQYSASPPEDGILSVRFVDTEARDIFPPVAERHEFNLTLTERKPGGYTFVKNSKDSRIAHSDPSASTLPKLTLQSEPRSTLMLTPVPAPTDSNPQPTGTESLRKTIGSIAAKLEPTGTIMTQGEQRLMIGRRAISPGATVTVSDKASGEEYQFELVSLTPTTFTLRCRGVEVTLPVKKAAATTPTEAPKAVPTP